MKGLIRFIATLITIVIIVALVFFLFDLTNYAHDPSNTTAHAIVIGVRNLFPEDWVAVYETWRTQCLTWLSGVLDVASAGA